MDPPAARKATQAQQHSQSVGFPSPTRDHARINPKFVDDCTRMNFAIQQSLPEAVRRIVRDHWEKCLLGSEFHQAFILNASIHHAVPSITQRAVRDFGHKMVAESKKELIGHFTAAGLDEVADIIVNKASDSFLDKCLAKRLLTIEAKPLINALAKAERLGYESNDVVQDDQHERVIPQEAYPGAAGAANGHQSQPSQPPSAHPTRQQQLQCLKCFRTFVHPSAYEHHSRYDLCSQIPPSANGFEHSCPHCGQGFTSPGNLHTHLNNMVCGNFGQVPKVSRSPGRPHPVSIPTSSVSESPATKSHPVQPQSTPAHASTMRRTFAATPGSSTASPNQADPYAHLTEQQLQLMHDELLAAEAKYAPRFAEAEATPDENLRRVRIEGLRNSFGTKQSMVRKKFGVRLRERRTKAEIAAERERLGIKHAEKGKGKDLAWSRQHNSSPSTNPDGTSRATTASGGWVAANTSKPNAVWEEHDAKRRRMDESGGYQTPYKPHGDDTPSRKTLSVAEIGGGLAGAAATAATHDPTRPPTSQATRIYEQSSASIEIHEPSGTSRQPVVKSSGTHSESATPSGGSDANGLSHGPSPARGPSPADMDVVAVEPDDSSSDDDDDIPSTLPPHMGKNPAGSTALLQTP
ncbi:hypothetical protein BT67DRAFT_402899 [Trichocladium antarcticum]|uniref:C2H2-type domain-containing protein n=1 Tax=Trichocladium antarcticum TaxID=1450529 RepID=A0AAN6ZE34_9PEZI|nr:hypothetical protein BT67DRAFT_402899 [Trichocladium antarcticum]